MSQVVGNELQYIYDCPRFDAIRAQYSNLFQDAAGFMRLFLWHREEPAVSHCLSHSANSPDMNTYPSFYARPAEWR